MSQRWEISKVSTPERVLQKIFTEVESPGIVLLGAGALGPQSLEGRVEKMLVERMSRCQSSVPWTILTGSGSCDNDKRREAVKMLKNRGAKNVIGVCVHNTHLYGESELEEALELLKHPPLADEFDYLITISEKDE